MSKMLGDLFIFFHILQLNLSLNNDIKIMRGNKETVEIMP